MARLILLFPLLLLSACNGAFHVSVDGNNVSVQSNIAIDEADLDLKGIKLYPGSVVHGFNFDAQDGKGARDHGTMTLSFDTPASLSTAQGWFRDSLTSHGYKIVPQGNGFSGTATDGSTIELQLDADGATKSKGRMTLAG